MPPIQLFHLTWEKSYEYIYHSPGHVSFATENILITIIRSPSYDLLLASDSTFKTDSQYLGTIQIWQNFNEYHYYLTSAKSMIYQIDAICSPFQPLNMLPFLHQPRMLKTDLLQFNINFSKYRFKTGSLCLLFLFSHVFTTLTFHSSF